MFKETLIPGIEFVVKNNLTKKEMEILKHFLVKPYHCQELSNAIKVPAVTLYGLIQRLKLKGLLVQKNVDLQRNIIYEFNTELLE